MRGEDGRWETREAEVMSNEGIGGREWKWEGL